MVQEVYLLDYGAGNVLSVVNAVESQGYTIVPIACAADFDKADKLIFPGVGAFASCMDKLKALG
jgi:glutamine amidotransferase/cyclase